VRPLFAKPFCCVLLLLSLLLSACGSSPIQADLPYSVLVQDAGLQKSFRGAAFGTGDRLWTSGTQGTILHRSLGDGSWTETTPPGAHALDLRDIDIRLDGEIFAMAAGEAEKSRLYFSESLGQYWQEVLANPDELGFFDSLAFDATGAGMLVGDPIGGAFTIFTSANGRDWTRTDRGRSPAADDGEYAFAASGNALISSGPGAFWLVTGGSHARIWHTESAGAVWFDTGAPDLGGSPSRGWFGIGAGPDGLIIAVGGDYAEPERASTFALLSGNSEWQVHEAGLPGFRSAVCAVPERPGFWVTVGSHGADWSRDNGQTWQALAIPGGHALTPAGPGQVLVVGGPQQPHRLVRFD
jgi:photosystem II stability/assembly factor-like uncharacterized protein